MQPLSFCDWLILFITTSSSFLWVVAYDRMLLFLRCSVVLGSMPVLYLRLPTFLCAASLCYHLSLVAVGKQQDVIPITAFQYSPLSIWGFPILSTFTKHLWASSWFFGQNTHTHNSSLDGVGREPPLLTSCHNRIQKGLKCPDA